MRRFSAKTSTQFRVRTISQFGCQPNMSEAFPSKNTLTAAQPQDKGVRVTELVNGTRIITHDLDEPTTAFGLYAEAGAKYDPANKPGLNYVMRWSFFTSNMENSQFQNDRAIRVAGASYEHQEIQKRLLGFKVECRRDVWQMPFERLMSALSVPRFQDVEIDRYRDTMDAALEELRWKTPRDYCIEQVEQLAFYREPLGNPRYVPPHINDDIKGKVLVDHWAKTFLPKRIIIAGVNVDHDALLAAYENAPFAHDASAPHFKGAKNLKVEQEEGMYQGGMEAEFSEKRYKEMSTKPFLENETIAALAWRSYGSDSVADYGRALVARSLLDNALEDGIRVPTGLDWGVRSFYSPYSRVGTIGLTVREEPKKAADAIRAAVKVFQGLTVTDAALKSAKQRATVRFFHDNMEVRRDYVDFLAKSLISGNVRISAAEILAAINDAKAADVKAAIEYSKAAAPCMYTTGEVLSLPSLKQLGLKN
eukprot:PhF_6_TR31419/c0_g1_i1/m.46059/K00415/QCR2, UQCRC2; ubiquinol-cytochrome c reductase core subunit 2